MTRAGGKGPACTQHVVCALSQGVVLAALGNGAFTTTAAEFTWGCGMKSPVLSRGPAMLSLVPALPLDLLVETAPAWGSSLPIRTWTVGGGWGGRGD